jgi:zinc protease
MSSKRLAGAVQGSSIPSERDVLRRTLPNGITVLVRENWSAPTVVVEGYLEAGNLDEPEALMGVASFTSSMLSRGTKRRSFTEINEAVESVGAALGWSADRYLTSFSSKSLAEDLDLVLDVLADELQNPTFPDEHIEKVRGLRRTALAERDNNTRQMASIGFRELCFAGHPLQRTLLGTRESLASIQRADLLEFYQRYYSPEGMVVAVVGAVSAEDAVARVERYFGGWTGSRSPRLPVAAVLPLPEIRTRRHVMPDKVQSDIVLGWPSLKRLDPDYEASRLANTVLGVFGMMGRLGANVREREGLAYYSYSQLSADRSHGAWALVAGVNPANVDKALKGMLDEVGRMREERVPEEELEDSKHLLTGSVPLQLETNDGVASILTDLEWHQLGLQYLQHYSETVMSLTSDQVLAAAQKYLNADVYALSIAGPA